MYIRLVRFANHLSKHRHICLRRHRYTLRGLPCGCQPSRPYMKNRRPNQTFPCRFSYRSSTYRHNKHHRQRYIFPCRRACRSTMCRHKRRHCSSASRHAPPGDRETTGLSRCCCSWNNTCLCRAAGPETTGPHTFRRQQMYIRHIPGVCLSHILLRMYFQFYIRTYPYRGLFRRTSRHYIGRHP